MLSKGVDLSDLPAKLAAWLRRKMPEAEDLTVSDVERAGAGFSNVSVPFTLRWREAGREKVAAMLFRGAGKSDPIYPDFKLERRLRVMGRPFHAWTAGKLKVTGNSTLFQQLADAIVRAWDE